MPFVLHLEYRNSIIIITTKAFGKLQRCIAEFRAWLPFIPSLKLDFSRGQVEEDI